MLFIDGKLALANPNVMRYGEIEQARSITLMHGRDVQQLKVKKGGIRRGAFILFDHPCRFFSDVFCNGVFFVYKTAEESGGSCAHCVYGSGRHHAAGSRRQYAAR
ncbi:hypothetical protein QS257_00355 [Terrilactibacillus sp. S3-3]|nr:hypothetical protein QS257_00355 [Terrilactibacillus sp. S3-3]